MSGGQYVRPGGLLKPFAEPVDVIFTYDGSFQGFLCCVHESVYSGELPVNIAPEHDAPLTLMDTRYIGTEPKKADKVLASIPKKISTEALELVQTVFLSCLRNKEIKLLGFLLEAYRQGGRLLNKLGDTVVAPLLDAQKHVYGEAHLLKGFIRFADVGGGLVATITPKNYILPFIARHFILRYDNEDFIIFDKTHKTALIYQNRRSEIIELESIALPEVSAEEARYQSLWKQFYNTIAIQGRENPRCRMTHMPKRYWENMLEVQDLL